MTGIICSVLQLYLYVIFARIILSWFPVGEGSAIAPVQSALFSVTEPVLGPLRRALPPLRLGGMGLDLSPIVVVIGISVLRGIICS